MLQQSLSREFLFEELIKTDPYLTVEQVAKFLNICLAQAHKLTQLGIIPTVRIGKSKRVRYSDLMKYIEKNLVTCIAY